MHSHDHTLLTRLGFQDPDSKNSDHDLACQYLIENAERFVRALGLAKAEKEIPYNFRNGKLSPTVDVTTESQMEVIVSKGHDRFMTTVGFLDVQIEFKLYQKFTGEQRGDDLHVKGCNVPMTQEEERVERLNRETSRIHEEKTAAERRYKYFREQIENDEYFKRSSGKAYQPSTSLFPSAPPLPPSLYTPPPRPFEKWVPEHRVAQWLPFDDNVKTGYGIVAVEVKITKTSIGDVLRQIKMYRQYTNADAWVVVSAFRLSATDLQTLRDADIKHFYLADAFTEWKKARAQDSKDISKEF